MLPSDAPVTPAPPPALGRARVAAFALIALIAVALVLGPLLADLRGAFPAVAATPAATHDPDMVKVALGPPETLDPAAAGDAGSAALIAQVFEGLTTVDADLVVRPALAESWTFTDGGRTAIFTLRDGLAFSDGTPLTAEDVRRSWMRVLDPASPSPLASLLDEVAGATDYQRGRGPADAVGLEADGRTLTVRFTRPATDFAAVAASPTLAVVPPSADRGPGAFVPGDGFVASGGYIPVGVSPTYIALRANDRYWAGRPAIGSIEVIQSLEGTSPVEAFRSGAVDLTPVDPAFASWLGYDRDLGPSLRDGVSVNLEYVGFDAASPPFDDARVRRAFATAVDWKRLVALGSDGTDQAATGMIPPAIPGRSNEDFVPAYDPDGARALLAEAGYPGGSGFPAVTFITSGNPHAAAIAAELEQSLGVRVDLETMDFTQYFDRLAQDPPGMWIVDWVADYPGRTAILRLLLGSDQQNNFGRWSSPAFDAALEEGSSATDAAVAGSAFDRAERIVRDDAPVVPLSYGTSYWLARDGLLGAGENGLGFVRFAGLAWADR